MAVAASIHSGDEPLDSPYAPIAVTLDAYLTGVAEVLYPNQEDGFKILSQRFVYACITHRDERVYQIVRRLIASEYP